MTSYRVRCRTAAGEDVLVSVDATSPEDAINILEEHIDYEVAYEVVRAMLLEEYPVLPVPEIVRTWGNASEEQIAAVSRVERDRRRRVG